MSFGIFIILLILFYCGGIITIFIQPNPFGWTVDEGKHKTPLWVHYYFLACTIGIIAFILTLVYSVTVGLFFL